MIFLKSCESDVMISETLSVLTKIDIPGPVTKESYKIDNGIILSWEPPMEFKGLIYSYFVEWVKNGENMSTTLNISTNTYKVRILDGLYLY